jgi:hypothetical protein
VGFACYFIWRRDLQRQRLFIANIRRRVDRHWKIPLLEGNDIRIHERNKREMEEQFAKAKKDLRIQQVR